MEILGKCILSVVFLRLHLCTTYIHAAQTVLKVSMSHQRWSLQSFLIPWTSLHYISCALSAGWARCKKRSLFGRELFSDVFRGSLWAH